MELPREFHFVKLGLPLCSMGLLWGTSSMFGVEVPLQPSEASICIMEVPIPLEDLEPPC